MAAFANTQGGFLVFGADAIEGRLHAFPGLDGGTEWPREVANNLVGHVSQLPAWEVYTVSAPGRRKRREVVVVKVPPSRRTPHILTATGQIYQRSPGGTSDPITDRATLDGLVERGDANLRAVRDRAARFLDHLPLRHCPAGDRGRKFQFALLSIPVPFGAFDQPRLLTRTGYETATQLFTPGRDLQHGSVTGMVEDGLTLEFGQVRLTVYRDGTIELFWTSTEHHAVGLPVLDGLIEDVLAAQRRLQRPVWEAHVFVRFGAFEVDLSERIGFPHGRRASAPWEFDWDAETLTGSEGSVPFRAEFARRMWRSAGAVIFDPE